jgi:hypothetical protein
MQFSPPCSLDNRLLAVDQDIGFDEVQHDPRGFDGHVPSAGYPARTPLLTLGNIPKRVVETLDDGTLEGIASLRD